MKSLLYILFLFSFVTSKAQTGKLTGYVTDGSSPIPSVNIIILETNFGTASEIDGNYEILNIPSDNYDVRFSSVGYDSKTFGIEIVSNKTTELNVELELKTIELEAVTVTDVNRQSQRDTRTSLIDLNPRDAKTLPGAVEDVFRTLQSLPGVLAPNDFSSQLKSRAQSKRDDCLKN